MTKIVKLMIGLAIYFVPMAAMFYAEGGVFTGLWVAFGWVSGVGAVAYLEMK